MYIINVTRARIDYRVVTKGNVTKIQPYHTHFLIVVRVFQKKEAFSVFSCCILCLICSSFLIEPHYGGYDI